MILNVRKPAGITSHDVVDIVRKITGEQRVGHAGTLDPFAEGVLVIGVGRESTKKLGSITKDTEKEYIATLELGKTSTTGDPEGIILPFSSLTPLRYPQDTRVAPGNTVPCSPKPYSEAYFSSAWELWFKAHLNGVKEILEGFKGVTWQMPPAHSAIKIKGKPAYAYAREGKTVDLPKREITIQELKLIEYAPPAMTIRVVCSSGTYIRSLAKDIGEKLNTGAYLTRLIRTRIGNFRLKDSISTEDLPLNLSLPKLCP